VTATIAAPAPVSVAPDRRGSWVPTWRLVATRFLELIRRKGLVITSAVIVIGLPSLFLLIRLLMHAFDPKTYGPAGGSDIYTTLVAGVMYVFGFIMAATIGATAGSSDLTDGMFRHLVVTGRSRLALYLARIPAGLAIILSMVAIGFTIVCVVCCFAAPTQVNYNGMNVPPGLSQQAFVTWSVNHADQAACNFYYSGPQNLPVPCGPNGVVIDKNALPPGVPPPTAAQIHAFVARAAPQNYGAYKQIFLAPPISLMVGSGLWLLLEATIGFIVALGLGSLMGQRTVPMIILIVLEVVLTPIFLQAKIPYMINVQRLVVGIAMAHLEPNGLTRVFGSDGGPNSRSMLLPEMTSVAVIVIIGWLVLWTVLGALRMVKRDA
jgi:hypothetical protein